MLRIAPNSTGILVDVPVGEAVLRLRGAISRATEALDRSAEALYPVFRAELTVAIATVEALVAIRPTDFAAAFLRREMTATTAEIGLAREALGRLVSRLASSIHAL
jgi:hypothetical protein